MKYLIAFIITILFHYFIYILLVEIKVPDTKSASNIKNKKSHIQYVSLKPKVKKTTNNKKITTSAKENFKKYIEKKNKKVVPKKNIVKKVEKKKIIKKILPKKIIKKKIIEKRIIKEIPDITESFYKKKKIIEKKEKIIIDKKVYDKQTQSFIDLYGDDFKYLNEETKLYLVKNIKNIGNITQRYLQYPTMSIQAGQSGISVVEFTLFPTGDISNLKIIDSSNFFLLDDNTIETIEEAYSDYPRPSKPTLIKIYVEYVLIN